jgi:hypothetical protein
MDSIGGAKILTERLLHRAPDHLQEDELRPIAAADAIPLFHWTGVEPAGQPEAGPAPPRSRRWRLRNG